MTKKIQGLFTSMITPFRKDNQNVDFDALMDIISFLSDHDCNGIIPFSSYGEFNSLSLIEKKEMLAYITESKGDLKVIPNIGSDNFQDTMDFAHYAQGVGVDALIIISPYFYKDVEIEGLTSYYTKIIDTIDIPVYLYNIPKFTGMEVSDKLIDNLMKTGKITGIKESSGDISFVQHIKTKYPELDIILANDNLLYEGLRLGINSFASGLFNVFPEIVKSVNFDFNQPKQGGKVAQNYLNEVNSVIKAYPRISALKYAATLRGVADCTVRPPLTILSPESEKSLKNELTSYINNPVIVS